MAGWGWLENPILMKPQLSVWTWTLDFDSGFVKISKKTSSVDSEIQNDDTTLDENLQKMILSRPVDEKNFSDIMVTALGLVIL